MSKFIEIIKNKGLYPVPNDKLPQFRSMISLGVGGYKKIFFTKEKLNDQKLREIIWGESLKYKHPLDSCNINKMIIFHLYITKFVIMEYHKCKCCRIIS